MLEKFLKLVNIAIEKNKFHSCKKAIDISDVDIKKILHLMSLLMTKTKNWMLNTSEDIKLVKQFDHYSSSFHKGQDFSINLKKQYMSFVIKNQKFMENMIQFGIGSVIS